MNRKHLANLFAIGVGFTTITANVEAATINESENIVFGIKPQKIALSECNETAVTIGNIHNMISKRNIRDRKLMKSSTDRMTHL